MNILLVNEVTYVLQVMHAMVAHCYALAGETFYEAASQRRVSLDSLLAQQGLTTGQDAGTSGHSASAMTPTTNCAV